jgi:hypothetical protein
MLFSNRLSSHLARSAYGFNTASCWVLFHIEVQSENVSEIIVQMRKHGVREIEVKEEASDRWNA